MKCEQFYEYFHVEKYIDFAIVNINEIICHVDVDFFLFDKIVVNKHINLEFIYQIYFFDNFNFHQFKFFFVIEINEYDDVIDRKIFCRI